MYFGADGMEPATYSWTILEGVLYMYPSSIQEGETQIFQLVTHSANLQAELAQVQINSRSAENDLQVRLFAEERNRLMNEIETTQRLIVCLDNWIREERINELRQQPCSIAHARDEISALLLKVADVRARIESIIQNERVCANLIAERRWISARLDFLKRWIDEQIILPEAIEIPKDVTEPRSITSAQDEARVLPHDIKVLITKFEAVVIDDNPDERVNLLLQIKSKEARNDFLSGWISQARKAQFQEIIEQVESISSDEPTSHSEARKQCERLSRLSMSAQFRIRRLYEEDDSELRRYLGRLQKEADERIGWLKEWIKTHKPTKVAKAQENPTPTIHDASAKGEPASLQEAIEERDSINTEISEYINAGGKSSSETVVRLATRRKFLNRWIQDYHDKSTLQTEGLSFETDDQILCSVDTVLIEIDREFSRAIAGNPKRLAIWNALRKRIGFGTIKPRRDD